MSAAPTLARVAPRLYALSSSGDAAPAAFWGGYQPGPAAQFGTTATLQQAWEDAGGCWLLLGAAPAAPAAFASAVAVVLAQLSPSGQVRVLWLENPNDPPAAWQLSPLLAQSSGSGPAIAWKVAREATLALGEYAVTVPRNTVLTQSDGSSPGWGIALAALAFGAPGGSWDAAAGSAWLPLAGATVGCLRGRLTLPGDGGDQLAALRVQLCFGAPRDDGAPGDAVDLLGMPVIAQPPGAPLTLALSFDPLHPLLAARTRLDFFDDDGGGGAVPRCRRRCGPRAATRRR